MSEIQGLCSKSLFASWLFGTEMKQRGWVFSLVYSLFCTVLWERNSTVPPSNNADGRLWLPWVTEGNVSYAQTVLLLDACIQGSQRLRRSWVMVQQNDLWLLSFWESGSAVGFCCTHAQTVGGVWLWARVNSSWSHPPRRPSCLSAGMAPFCG